MINHLEARNQPAMRPVGAVATIAGAATQRSTTPRETALQQRSPEEIRALTQQLKALAEPGPEHERLAAMEGTWDIEITI